MNGFCHKLKSSVSRKMSEFIVYQFKVIYVDHVYAEGIVFR